MNLIKKIVAITTVFTVLSFVGGPALAVTAEELQAQITALLAQLTALQAQLATLQGVQPTVTRCTITSFAQNLKQGMTGDDVKCLQIILNSSTDTKVADSGAGSPGSETTYFGSLTKAAVIKFQEKYASAILASYGLTTGTGFVGTTTRAKLNTLLGVVIPPTGCTTDANCPAGYMCSAGTCVVRPVGAAMSVALAVDTPVAANLWKGSANNVVTKFTFYGGSTASTITGLTLTNYGTTESTYSVDLSAIKILDEFNVQQGTDRTMAGNKAVFVIIPGITVPANGTKTLSVAVNVGTSAVVMEMIKLGLASAADISGATFTGTFPMAGNGFTIVPAGSIGSLTVAQFGSLPVTTARVGQKDVVLEKFNVSAGSNEDVTVNQFTIKNSSDATISDSDITNIRVREVGGAVIAGPGNLSSKKVTLNLATPFLMTKGTSKNLEVIADIVSGPTAGATRTVYLWLDTGAVVGQGKLSGVNMTSTGTTTANAVTLSVGAVTVSMSSAHPQGANALMILTTNKKILGVFSVKAVGENVTFSTIKAKFVGGTAISTTNDITNVGLYVDGALISDQLIVDTNNTDEVFSVNWTLPADTTKDVVIMGQTSTMDFTTSCTVTTSWSYYSGVGLSSGETITNDTDVAATAITVYPSGKVTVSADATKTPYSQGLLSPVNGAIIGAIKVYAQKENQKLTDLVITVSGDAGYDDEGDISSVTLYDAAGTTQLSNPVVYGTAGADDTVDTFTFASTDFLNPIIFTSGQYLTMLVKANVSSTADGAATVSAYIANAASQFKTEGVDSGTAYNFSTDATADLHLKISSPYAGGEFTLDKTLVEIKKAATSPSGTASGRGTFATYAIFDVSNVSSDSVDAVITAVTFTSKTGLPSTVNEVNETVDGDKLFALYDGNGNLLAGGVADFGSTEITLATGTVAFTNVGLTVHAGQPEELVLEITTTSLTVFPTLTQMQWMIYAVGDVTVTGASASTGYAGFGGTVYSIPAIANIVTLP